jgi:REP element-mobilizing transposase RayT
MPRPARKDVLGDGECCVHLVYRCHNGDFLLNEAAKQLLYNLLLSLKSIFSIKIYDYVFMDNHIHLVLYLQSTVLLSKFMQKVFSLLGTFINKQMKRSGRVFGERPKTPVIKDRRYYWNTTMYISKNPIRANICNKPQHYKWSGFRHYAYGEKDLLIDDSPEYLGLSKSPALRRKLYQKMAHQPIHRHEKRKPEMSSWYFIGDADWVKAMLIERGFIKPPRPPGVV